MKSCIFKAPAPNQRKASVCFKINSLKVSGRLYLELEKNNSLIIKVDIIILFVVCDNTVLL